MKSMIFKMLVAASCLGVANSASAEITSPECIAPARPGGGFDLTCRIAQMGLKGQFEDPIQVIYMPGGIGAVAFNLFNTKRTSDSNAIVAFSSGSLLNIATGKFGKFDENDVRFVATAGADFGAVIVPVKSKYQTLSDLMDDFKTDPGKIVVGAGGSVGSQDWMKGALLLKSVGSDPRDMRYVAFDGGGEAISALLGGSIEVYMGDVGEMAPHLEAGTMRVLAVMSGERLPAPFDVFPTAIELGYDAEWTIMRGFYMGNDVPEEDFQTWATAFAESYKTDEFKKIRKEKGLMPLELHGADMDKKVKELIVKLRGIAIEAGLIEQ